MKSVYETVTENMIAQLEKGTIPWRKPWQSSVPTSLGTGKEYRGLNVFLLGIMGRPSKYWLTAKKAEAMGFQIAPIATPTLITYWNVGKNYTRTRKDADGQEVTETRRGFFLRFHEVYNLADIAPRADGVTLAEVLGLEQTKAVANVAEAEAIINAMQDKPKFVDSDSAWYRPSADTIGLPTTFHTSEERSATTFHELVHSTGHASRLKRAEVMQTNFFGSEAYSKEELVAELGAAMLCGVCGISPATQANSAAYLAAWIKKLRGDSKLVVSAASAAQKAADYIRGIKATSAEDSAEVAASA